MSKASNDLRITLDRRIHRAATGTFDGVVEAVDQSKRTCSVSVGDVTYEDVSLYAVENAQLKGFCIVPKVGSGVIVSRIGGSNMLYVAMFSEVDKVIVTIGDSCFTITDNGFTVTRDGSGLKKTLQDLCDAIGRLTVSTSSGPSGVPINRAEFSAIKNELNKYLEG